MKYVWIESMANCLGEWNDSLNMASQSAAIPVKGMAAPEGYFEELSCLFKEEAASHAMRSVDAMISYNIVLDDGPTNQHMSGWMDVL
jgi:hypothetical protein